MADKNSISAAEAAERQAEREQQDMQAANAVTQITKTTTSSLQGQPVVRRAPRMEKNEQGTVVTRF